MRSIIISDPGDEQPDTSITKRKNNNYEYKNRNKWLWENRKISV